MDKFTQEIIVLGSTGTIGSKLSARYIEDGFVTHCLSRDNSLTELVSSKKNYTIINCAFNFGGTLEANINFLEYVSEFIQHATVKRFINISTIDSYSNLIDGFAIESKPDTSYGQIKREIDRFISEKFNRFTKVHLLIIGAVNDNGSSWSQLMKSRYLKDRSYKDEVIPIISIDEIYEAINEINDQSPLHISPKHNWFYLRDLKFMHDKVLFSAFLRFILRNKLTATTQKVLRKLKLGQSVQADLFLFERLASRSENFKR